MDQGPAARLSSSLDDKSAPSHARTANKGKKKSAREAARQNSKLEEESQTPSLPAYCRKTPPVDVSPAPAASNSLGTNDSGFSQYVLGLGRFFVALFAASILKINRYSVSLQRDGLVANFV